MSDTANDWHLQQSGMWRKFVRLTRSGVAVIRALEIIVEESSHADVQRVAKALHDRLRRGEALEDAMQAMPGDFSLSARELAKTAARRGAWDEVLWELAEGLADGTFT